MLLLATYFFSEISRDMLRFVQWENVLQGPCFPVSFSSLVLLLLHSPLCFLGPEGRGTGAVALCAGAVSTLRAGLLHLVAAQPCTRENRSQTGARRRDAAGPLPRSPGEPRHLQCRGTARAGEAWVTKQAVTFLCPHCAKVCAPSPLCPCRQHTLSQSWQVEQIGKQLHLYWVCPGFFSCHYFLSYTYFVTASSWTFTCFRY